MGVVAIQVVIWLMSSPHQSRTAAVECMLEFHTRA